MSNEEIYIAWAPEESPWSRWAKPVLFSFLDLRAEPPPVELSLTDLSWAPPAHEKVSIVIDLAGVATVQWGLELARRGYRPVPLFNAAPPLPVGFESYAAVDVRPILAALWKGGEILRQVSIPVEAPPAFLLDANRAGTRPPTPGEFNNRSVSFTADFPSAIFLRAQGIQRALLVTGATSQPQSDLAHTLFKWQEGGLEIFVKRLDSSEPPVPCAIRRPSRFQSIFQRALAMVNLRRNVAGGFGRWLPDPEGHGGGG